MDGNLNRRKDIRLKGYDYSKIGYYFVTICVKDRKKILSKIVGGGFHATPSIKLHPIGREIVNTIKFIEKQNKNIYFDKYIIMPNHIHMIIVLEGEREGGHGNPPLHKIIASLKSFTNRRFNEINNLENKLLWQRNYYDHIIRNEEEYNNVWEYIDTNHLKWEDDKYYI